MAKKQQEGPRVVGEVVTARLDTFKPNPWNPNKMTPHQVRSLKHGLRTDGWLSSQALLVWRKDERGKTRMLIIDGEHRWKCAREEGFVQGPVVFLDGLTEAQAKALTIKLDSKRGQFDTTALGALLRDLQQTGAFDDMALEFGFTDEELAQQLAEIPTELPGVEGADRNAEASSNQDIQTADASDVDPDGHTRMVQLFFSKDEEQEFKAIIEKAAKLLKTENVTATALAIVRAYAKAKKL